MILKALSPLALVIFALLPVAVQAGQEAVFINDAVLEALGSPSAAEGRTPGALDYPLLPLNNGEGDAGNPISRPATAEAVSPTTTTIPCASAATAFNAR